MKILRSSLLIAVTMVAMCVAPAEAQVRFGLKAGVTLNSLHLNKNIGSDLVSSNNRAGFTGGIMAEIGLPVVGLGIDASVLYSRRTDDLGPYSDNSTLKRDYINVPINLKYKLSLPLIGKFVKPFATTGPEFSFLVGDNFKDFSLSNTFNGSKMNLAWNIGAGLEVMSRVQVHANYSLGMTRALKWTGLVSGDDYDSSGKDKYWTVTVAYLF